VLLFLVLFYVYPLKFVFTLLFAQIMGESNGGISTAWQGSVVMRIYAVGFASVFLLFGLMYRHAYKLRGVLGLNAVEELETKNSVRENLLMAGIGVLAFLVAFRYPQWSGWTYVLIAPALTVHGSVYGRRVRLMAEKMGMG
jgi:hypothetical protein